MNKWRCSGKSKENGKRKISLSEKVTIITSKQRVSSSSAAARLHQLAFAKYYGALARWRCQRKAAAAGGASGLWQRLRAAVLRVVAAFKQCAAAAVRYFARRRRQQKALCAYGQSSHAASMA
ncbi:hypothetical protein NPIL_51561 [Nephila pilipes]|uniref:Uncharacterized protein n=1 Tax=Nephila pilipes TaxID=299642 RepID=A0A8X6UA43_NEPPI|nr:hypothetical protein NPIL_51561 [Nephila pilipes]